jgi:hypothetical protein
VETCVWGSRITFGTSGLLLGLPNYFWGSRITFGAPGLLLGLPDYFRFFSVIIFSPLSYFMFFSPSDLVSIMGEFYLHLFVHYISYSVCLNNVILIHKKRLSTFEGIFQVYSQTFGGMFDCARYNFMCSFHR